MLKGKTVVLGVTGSIAAYKTANLASMLVKQHADVTVIMTENATNFINPITFETLTGNKCLVDTFDRSFQYSVEHVALANKADVVMIAPATANVIAKLAHGIADDMLTTTVLACKCKKIVAPAMNTNMLDNPMTQDNIHRLRKYDFEIIEPAKGRLACGDEGAGKLPSEEVLFAHILREILYEKDMAGKKVLITAGPTIESIDPVRYISNHSTGKMGYALARVCAYRGAEVTLVSGRCALAIPEFVKTIEVVSAEDMFEAVEAVYEDMDIVIMAAAVADYTPVNVSDSKIKKKEGDITIPLKRTQDILKYVGEHKKPGQFICGFAMETDDLVANATAKLESKKADMIVANSLREPGAGFATDTNIVTLITKDNTQRLTCLPKDTVASVIVDEILKKLN
ncbi:MAG: bifunctional phosphopantothenoylcysteine decarboxylase/phosphopantothenate--cysteine ligase CoaBC [Lachnospiraceae bacterium]|nr:bifunctional phosphopantothenoylcysteine decarboxylase/phosphopantothenate--cysteine ligase CoaBC [Lachnospiraceae bacterium]